MRLVFKGLIVNVAFKITRTTFIELVLFERLCIYLLDDDLAEVETCRRDVTGLYY